MTRRLIMLLVLAQTLWLGAEITAPETIAAGSVLEIQWSGERPKNGRFQIVTEQGETLKGGAHGYLDKLGKTSKLAAPSKPGTYGVALAMGGEFHGLKTFKVTAVTATLEPPANVEMNAAFKIRWTGPAYGSDIIAVAKVGSNKRMHLYAYPKQSMDGFVTLRAPLEPGDYDVIYLMKAEVLARKKFTVSGTEASVRGPKTVQAGGDLEIYWAGPNNKQDLISLVKKGAARRSAIYGFTGVSQGNRLMLVAPEALGDYEVVYFTGGQPLARTPIRIVDVSATLDAPDEIVAGLDFEIAWTGPGNRQDSIVMMPGKAAVKRPYSAQAYVVVEERRASMTAPKKAGDYTLHYLTRAGKVLASRPVKVAPAPSNPGFVKISGHASQSFGANSAVELILDASGSMLKRQGEKRRIEIAKETILELISDVIPSGTGFAMRVFGHKEADSCRTDLEIPLGPLDPATAKLVVSGIKAMNLAKTPIAASLSKVGTDLQAVTGERIIILVTDGEETCEGDPALAIRQLRSEGTDIRINIIGYSIDSLVLRETFESWAALGGGKYLNAPDAQQLAQALRQALQIPFEIFSEDSITASGIAGGARVELPAGDYQVRYRWDGREMTKALTIVSNTEVEVTLP